MHRGELMVCAPPASITSSLPGEVWEIRCDSNRLAKDKLRAIDGVTADLVGETLHLILEHRVATMERLTHRLKQEGLRILETRKVHPSLEDAFLYSIQKGGKREFG
jgi:hypothetical protein